MNDGKKLLDEALMIAHDALDEMGGAEAVMLGIVKQFPRAQFVTAGSRASSTVGDAALTPRIKLLGDSVQNPYFRLPTYVMRFALHGLLRSSPEIVLVSGLAAPALSLRKRQSKFVMYCHHVPRFAHDLHDYWRGSLPIYLRPFFGLFCILTRYYFSFVARRMDKVVANSLATADDLERYYGVSAEIIHPPTNVEFFESLQSQGYFLSTARHEPYKRVDEIVAAFLMTAEKNLIVTSHGSQTRQLMEMAAGAKNITFTGRVTDEELRALLSRCTATIYVPMREDFGLSVVESLASGKPVITVADGGPKELVEDGKTAIFLTPDNLRDSLVHSISAYTTDWFAARKEACIEAARPYAADQFYSQLESVLMDW